MSELLSRYERAGLTKRANTVNAFLDVADTVFSSSRYSDIAVQKIYEQPGTGSGPSFYNHFPGKRAKSAWGSAVLNRRLNDALDQELVGNPEKMSEPRVRLLGHLGLLAAVSAPLPGITKALVDERTDFQASYSDLLPRYYDEVTRTIATGQDQHEFTYEMSAENAASEVLDDIAMAYAVNLDDPVARAQRASRAVDGLLAN